MALHQALLALEENTRSQWSLGYPGAGGAANELAAALKPKRSVKLAATRRTAKRETKKEETARIREAVMARCAGYCEWCGTAGPDRRLELDHFFGRVRVQQSERTCWMLCPACHFSKTRNVPSATVWLERFIGHAGSLGYHEEAGMATRRLGMVQARAELSAGVGR